MAALAISRCSRAMSAPTAESALYLAAGSSDSEAALCASRRKSLSISVAVRSVGVELGMERIAMLTGEEIAARGIVEGLNPEGKRPTTYDATVGHIVRCGKEIQGDEFDLPSRGIAWIISEETFNVPCDATGLATLRTTWTHDGVLALNVGVVDPGWHGPLAAAVVNFSNSDFTIKKGDRFLRLMFQGHSLVESHLSSKSAKEYMEFIKKQSKLYSNTFLNMESLVPEITQEIFALPKIVVKLTQVGVLIGALAILVPVAYSVYTDTSVARVKIESIEDRLERQQTVRDPTSIIEQLEARVSRLERESLGGSRPAVDDKLPAPNVTVGAPQEK